MGILQRILGGATGGMVSVSGSVTSGNIPQFSGTSGTVLTDSAKAFSTDGTFASNSDAKVPTEKAVKTYTDALVVGLLDDRGNYDASTNLFPSSGGSGTAGAILKGDIWRVSVAGTLGGTVVAPDDWVRALVDAPGQTASNWTISEASGLYVTGAASSTDNAITRFDSTTGKLIQNSVAILDDVGALSGLTQLDVDNIRIDGNTISSTDTNGNISLTPNGTGAVVATGQVNITGSAPSIEVGAGVTGNQNAFIDLIGDTTYSDFGLRIIRQNTGANTASVIIHRGTGEFSLQTQDAGAITFYTNNTLRATINAAGNLVLTGVLFSADFSNATRGNRLNFQTSTTNSNTGVGAIPNGTATTSAFVTYGGSDPDNAAYAQFHATDSSHVGINSSKTGAGTTQPIDLQIDSVTGFRLQTDGNTSATNGSLIGTGLVVGFSGTPSADTVQVGDSAFKLDYDTGTIPRTQYDTGDYAGYNRASDNFAWGIGGSQIASMTGNYLTIPRILANNATSPTLETASGMTNTGSVIIRGKTSGRIVLTTADATAQILTVRGAAQTVGDATVTIPDFAGVSDTFAAVTLAQTLANKTLTAPKFTALVSAKTNGVGSPYSITTSDSGTYFTNTGASAEVYLNLPAATSGLVYHGACTDTDLMRFVANGTDTIRDGSTVSAAGGYCQLGELGATVKLVCFESGKWTVMAANGTINVV